MNGSVKIGDKEQIFSTSAIVKTNEIIQFNINVPAYRSYDDKDVNASQFMCEISFQNDSSGTANGEFFATDTGGVRFIFMNWNSSLGIVTTEPVKFGDVGAKKLLLNIANHAIQEINVCQISILLG